MAGFIEDDTRAFDQHRRFVRDSRIEFNTAISSSMRRTMAPANTPWSRRMHDSLSLGQTLSIRRGHAIRRDRHSEYLLSQGQTLWISLGQALSFATICGADASLLPDFAAV